MFRDIKNFILPVLKNELEKTCKAWIDYTLYSEPYDYFNKVVPYSGKKQTYVIGKCIVRY